MPQFSAERISEHFANYLFHDYGGHARHVYRVAPWLGLMALGIEKIKGKWKPASARQLVFEIGSKRYKARYDHAIKRGIQRGGIAIVEVEKSRGSPDIKVVKEIGTLAEAEKFYKTPRL